MASAEYLRKKRIEELGKTSDLIDLVEELPDNLPISPMVSINKLKPGIWPGSNVSFSQGFREKFDPLSIIRAFEDDGWHLLPATLCKWGNWRPSVGMGYQEDMAKKGREKLGIPYKKE